MVWSLSEKARVLSCQAVEAHTEPAVKMKLLSLAVMLCPRLLSLHLAIILNKGR